MARDFESQLRTAQKIILICFFIVSILGVFTIAGCARVINTGEIGVKRTWGVVKSDPLQNGLHLYMPFVSRIDKVNVKTNQIEEVMSVPSKEGLVFDLDVSVIYNIRQDKAVDIVKTVSANFEDTMLIPYFRSAVRDIVSGKEAKDIYSSSGRNEVETQLKSMLGDKLGAWIVVQDVLLRKVTFPDTVRMSIESKLASEQKAQQKVFDLQQAQMDAQIEIARANGTARANEIVGMSITDNYLRYLYVQGLQTNQMQTVYIPVDGMLPVFDMSQYTQKMRNGTN